MVRAPGDIFSYMQSNKIGEKVSLFWIAWAFVAERAQNFKLTDQIFSKGIKRQAEPKEMLTKRYQQFQRRMARHLINKQQEETDRQEAADAEGVSSSGTTAITSSSSSSRSANSSNDRNALSRLSKSRGTSSQRTGTAVSSQSSNAGFGNVKKQTVQPPIHTSSSSSVGMGNFQIFSDDSASALATRDLTETHVVDIDIPSENNKWDNLGSIKSQVKENTVPVTKWNEGGLSSSSSSSSSRRAGRDDVPVMPLPSFSIFTEDELTQSSSKVEAKAKTETIRNTNHMTLLSQRSKTVVDHDPLEHIRKEKKTDNEKPSSSTVTNEENPSIVTAKSSSSVPAPTVMSASTSTSTSKPTLGSSFAIFTDTDADAIAAAPAPAPAPVSLVSKFAKTPKQITQPPAAAPASSHGGFSIFADDSAMDSHVNVTDIDIVSKRQITAQHELDEFESLENEAATASASGNVNVNANMNMNINMNSQEDLEFDNMMADMDEVDGTINTRLAMGAINSMFCSPDAAPVRSSSSSSSSSSKLKTTSNNNNNFLSRPNFSAVANENDLSAIVENTEDHSVFALNTPTMTMTTHHPRGGGGISKPPQANNESFTGGGFTIFED
jgi:hypothetical protein